MPKTVLDKNFQLDKSDFEFNYQIELTKKLDNTSSSFDQNIINEIVLWKVNRYAEVENNLLTLLNSIDPNDKEIDLEKTKNILKALISKNGIQLAMASTILRFRNKNIYQIIDQRVYRIIYRGKKLKIKTYSSEKNINDQIELYVQYLKDLRSICRQLNIPFSSADRILYMADKRINNEIKLENY